MARMAKLKLYRLVRTWDAVDVDEGDAMMPKDAAQALGVTVSGVLRFMEDGTLPAFSMVDEGKLFAGRPQRYTSRKSVLQLKKVRAGRTGLEGQSSKAQDLLLALAPRPGDVMSVLSA